MIFSSTQWSSPVVTVSVRRLFMVAAVLLLAACASRPYQGVSVDAASFLQRAVVQEQGDLLVSVAVPDAQEAQALSGLDLYEQGIQPVWIKIENRSDSKARVVTWSIDRDYFSPIEVAYMNRKPYSGEGYDDMQRWFHENSLPRIIPAGESRSGLVYTNLRPGTKGFNMTLIHQQTAVDLTFFVPLPGFVADFMEVDFAGLYESEEIRQLKLGELRQVLENELGCCATDKTGELAGGPFNSILVGTGIAVRRAMLRGGWLETSADDSVAPRARLQTWQGRRPDAIFSQKREDGDERIVLQLWMAPWRFEGAPVWVGQVYYFHHSDPLMSWIQSSAIGDTEVYQRFAKESLVADIDSAQNFLNQNLWYGGSLAKVGHITGVGASTMDEPRRVFDGPAYFTKGLRMVAFLSEEALALDEVVYLNDPKEYAGGGKLAVPFQGRQIEPPNKRIHIEHSGSLTVATAVPSAEEARKIFDVDLYAKNLQPVWVQVENRGDSVLYLTPMGIDKAYYTPREAAFRSSKESRAKHTGRYEKRGHVQLAVPPGSIQSGYIFTRVDEGTKSFNVDVVGQGEAHLMSFFVPVPGLKLDHYDLDFKRLYSAGEIRDVSLPELVEALEAMPCCVRDAKGETKGDPLNLVFIGDPKDLYYAFMRAGWDETETIYGSSLWKTGLSALTGGAYRYSPVSALYVFDRGQDAAFQRARGSIHERNHLRVWMTPLRHEGKPVWIGQISRDIGVHFTRKTITTHKIDPDVDETREFLVEDLAFTQSLKAFGYVGGVGNADYDSPRGNLTGDPYFTDGRRVVMWISGEPLGLDEIEPRDLTVYHTGVVGD